MNPLILTGAYGKTYSTRNEAARAWVQGADFKLYMIGSYCSIRDVEQIKADGYDCVTILIANGEPYRATL